MDAETLDVILTRLTLRLQEAHQAVEGADDLRAGHRIGLIHALNITVDTINLAQAEVKA